MKQEVHMPDHKRRRGIALVVVLGFVSLLMLMIVGFAISQRVERLVARAWLDGVKADQLVDVAIARALDQLENQVADDPFPDQSAYFSGTGTAIFDDQTVADYLPAALNQGLPENDGWVDLPASSGVKGRVAWLAVNCSGLLDANVIAQTDRNAGLAPAEIRLPAVDVDKNFPTNTLINTWIQAMDQREVRQIAGADPQYLFPFSYAPPEWDDIPVVLDQTDDGIYRYINKDGKPAELPLNTSWRNNKIPDWIDAYRAGMALNFMPVQGFPRQTGNESMKNLPHTVRGYLEEMLDESGTLKFSGKRPKLPLGSDFGPDHGYDTLEKISRMMADFFALYNMGKGLPVARANSALIPYAFFNPDYIVSPPAPQTPSYHYHRKWPFVQPFPWVTQVWAVALPVSDPITGEVSPGELEVHATIEFVNPYQIPIDTSFFRPRFRIDYPGTVVPNPRTLTWRSNATPGELPGVVRPTLGGIENNNINVNLDLDNFPQRIPSMSPGQIVRIDYVARLTFPAGTNIIFHPRVVQYIFTASGYDFNMGFHYFEYHSLHAERAIWDKGISTERLFLCNDPRLFYGGERTRWYSDLNNGDILTMLTNAGGARPSAIPSSYHNTPTGNCNVNQTSGSDGTHRVYFPEKDSALGYPRLDSLSHWGRQPYSNRRHWTSIPLVGTNAVDVARFFSMTNALPQRTGRININTPYREVLASAFLEANTDMSGRGSAATIPLSRPDALKLADLIIGNRPKGGYRRVIDALRSSPRDKWETALGGRNKFEVEELLMRSQRLLTTRQQIFTIFLAAQTQSSSNDVLGESRALAVVWRDPFRTDNEGRIVEPGESGYDAARHRTRLLHFVHLTN